MICEMEVVFPLADVLSALWYGDGGGAKCSVSSTDCPDDYHVYHASIDDLKQTIKFTLHRGAHPGVNDGGGYDHEAWLESLR